MSKQTIIEAVTAVVDRLTQDIDQLTASDMLGYQNAAIVLAGARQQILTIKATDRDGVRAALEVQKVLRDKMVAARHAIDFSEAPEVDAHLVEISAGLQVRHDIIVETITGLIAVLDRTEDEL